MEIKVEVKLLGLEPLVEAIKELAVAHSTSALQATEAIGKASTTSKKSSKAATTTDAKPEASATGGTQDTLPPATTAADPAPTQSSPTDQPDAGVAPAAEVVEEKKSETNPTTSDTPTSDQAESSDPVASTTSQAAPAADVVSDEKLRELAGAAAKKDKDKVRALVAALGVASVSAVPAEKRAQFVADLAAV